MVRTAEAKDLESMLDLSEQRRRSYESHSPIFWRVAVDGRNHQSVFFEKQLADSSFICLVYEVKREIRGFIIGRIVSAPPVYSPGGGACLIDDFALRVEDDWPTVGVALELAVAQQAKAAGAVVQVTVCGHHDEPKRRMLRDLGFHVASEWHVRPL